MYGDLFFAVQDTQVRVLDDDGDDFAAVARTQIDVLAATMLRPRSRAFPSMALRHSYAIGTLKLA